MFLPKCPRILSTVLSTSKASENHFRIFQNFSDFWLEEDQQLFFSLSQKRGCSPTHEDKPSERLHNDIPRTFNKLLKHIFIQKSTFANAEGAYQMEIAEMTSTACNKATKATKQGVNCLTSNNGNKTGSQLLDSHKK